MKIVALLLASIVLLAPGGQDEARIKDLVEKLRRDSLAEREEATEELIGIGEEVLPHLKPLNFSDDPEIRERAAAVKEGIAKRAVLRSRWKPGKSVTLEVRDEPLDTVLKKIAAQTGTTFHVDPSLTDKVTVKMSGRTFWDALFLVLETYGRAAIEFDEEQMKIVPRKHHERHMQIDGEFVAWLEFARMSRTYSFDDNGPRAGFDLEIHTAWESHVKPLAVKLELDSVEDDTGTDLIIPQRGFYYGDSPETPKTPHQKFTFTGRLNVPDEKAKSLSVVRGVATFIFPMKYEKLNIELQNSSSRSTLGKSTFTLQSVQLSGRGFACQMDVSSSREFGSAEMDRLGKNSVFLVDDEGKEHPVSMESNSTSWSSRSITRHYSVTGSVPGKRAPKFLRIKALSKSHEKRVKFAFKNLPIR